MIAERHRLVQESWALAAADVGGLAARFYARLFDIDPRARALFAHADMAAQRAKITRMLGELVSALDAPDRLVPQVAALGRRHASYGVTDRHYRLVGEALLSALAGALGAALTPEHRSAWAEAYTLVAAIMRRAGTQHVAPSHAGV
jgi:hemoglobin-like flavoprotein